MQNFSTFLVLVSLLASIRGDSSNGTENKITPRLLFANNLNETLGKTFMTINKDETHNVNEVKDVDKEKSTDETKKCTEDNKNVSHEMRKSRDADISGSYLGIECVSCYGSGISASDEKCYDGGSVKTQICADVEQCYTELHPQYIKRGCTLPSSINRTFICKCPLCNDKPSEDLTHYAYRTISDWEYDNKRLEKPVVGLDLLCKVCDTRGVNSVADKQCQLGKNADYMQCGHNQLCFINIDHQIDLISRGCINKPAYNAFYSFCNKSKCNNEMYPNPRTNPSEFKFRTAPLVKVVSSASNKMIETVVVIFFLMALSNDNLFTIWQ